MTKFAGFMLAVALPLVAGNIAAQPAPQRALPTQIIIIIIIIIQAGGVIAVPSEPALGPQMVVVRDGVIASVQPGRKSASAFGADVKVIDLSDKVLMSGLIDLHMHLAIMMNADPSMASLQPGLALASARIRSGIQSAIAGLGVCR